MIAGITVIFFCPSQATVEALKKQIADKMVSILCKNLAIEIYKLLYKGVVLCLLLKDPIIHDILVQVTMIISDFVCWEAGQRVIL